VTTLVGKPRKRKLDDDLVFFVVLTPCLLSSLRNMIGEVFEFASRPEVKDEKNLSDIEREWRREERRKRLTL
jgi:hypothetical protein